MKHDRIERDKDTAMEAPAGGKRAYLKPAFRHEPVFETMALACGKINPTQGACRGVKKSS